MLRCVGPTRPSYWQTADPLGLKMRWASLFQASQSLSSGLTKSIRRVSPMIESKII